jgi:hypothetical protein
MPLYTKKEFAERCGMKTNQLAVYIKRGKVVVGNGELIDTKNEKNKAFLQRYSGQTTEANLIKEIAAVTPPESATHKRRDAFVRAEPDSDLEEDDDDLVDIPALPQSERKLKFLDTLKREQEVRLLRIKEEKLKGQVVPSELIKPVMLQHNQSILSEFKNATDEILRVFAKRRDLQPDEVADIRGQLTLILNEAISKAATATAKSIDGIIENYTEARGKGERK